MLLGTLNGPQHDGNFLGSLHCGFSLVCMDKSPQHCQEATGIALDREHLKIQTSYRKPMVVENSEHYWGPQALCNPDIIH